MQLAYALNSLEDQFISTRTCHVNMLMTLLSMLFLVVPVRCVMDSTTRTWGF